MYENVMFCNVKSQKKMNKSVTEWMKKKSLNHL